MKVTPLELKKADFKRGLRGYNPDEVQQLLASAAESLEEAVRDNKELKEKIIQLQERLRYYESMEKTINETMLMAQKSSAATRQATEREAELIVARAEVEAEKLLEEARAELKGTRREIEMLGHERHAFLVKMRSLVASQWKLLQEESVEQPEYDVDNQPPVAGRGKRSMVKPTRAGLAEETTASAGGQSDLDEMQGATEQAQKQADEEENERMKDLSGHLGKIFKSENKPEEQSGQAESAAGGGAGELVWDENAGREGEKEEIETVAEEESVEDFFGGDEEEESEEEKEQK